MYRGKDMGRFENKNVQGLKYYDVFTKQTFKEIFSLQKFLPLYSFEAEGPSKKREIYYDTPAKLLDRAGISLCKVTEQGKAFFTVERQNFIPQNSAVLVKEEKVFIHDINEKDTIQMHMYYLIDAIQSMFSTNFNIDLENVLKTVVPKLEIITQSDVVKVFSGNGFKARMEFENVTNKNYETKRTAPGLVLKVQMISSITHMSSYIDFTSKLEKYCKKIIPLKESKYQIALRHTKPIVVDTTAKEKK